MAKNQGRIQFGIDFNVNTASLNKVRETLKSLKAMTGEEIKKSGGNILDLDKGAVHSWKNNLKSMRDEVSALEKAFEAAYNPKLGTYELNKFNESLKTSGTTAAQAFATVANYGANGKAALLDMTTGMLSFERVGKQTNETFKKLGDTMMNTIRWSVTSTAINTVTGAIQSAYHYAVNLDRALNDIMIVTDKSSREMEVFAKSANKAAKALGASTQDYAEASLIYYQQGLSDKEVSSRTETTLKAAAITGQSAEQVSEQLTAVWNGYKVSAEESELYIDKLSAVAAATAADLEELSVGMSKVASAANIMGVDVDQLNAQLATIVSVTREAPESIGTALKTVYARMSDIQAGIDTETTLDEYTSQMARMGINVLDANGKLRDMGSVVEEIGNNWSSLNREQQVSLAQSIAGTRQYSRMMALFDNWDMYQESLVTSMESAGTLSQQHIEYLQSVEAHQEKLRASAEGLYDTIFDSDQIKGVYDVLTGLVEGVNGLVKGLGGMPGILAVLVALGTTIGKQSIQDLIIKGKANKMQTQLYKSQIENGKAMIENLRENVKGGSELESQLNKVLDLEDMILNNAGNLTEDQFNKLQTGVKQYSDNLKEAIEVEKQYNSVIAEKKDLQEKTSGMMTESFTDEKEGKIKYNLNNERTSNKGKGRSFAKRRLASLQKMEDRGEIEEEQKKELEYLKKYLPLAERKNELMEQEKEKKKELANVNKKVNETNKGLEEGIKNELTQIEKANLITTYAQGISMVGMSAALASGSVQSFASAMSDSNAGFTDWIGGFTGLAGAAFSIIGPMHKAKGVINSTASTAEKAGARIQYAFGWVSLVLGAVSALIQVVKEFKQAEIDAANAIIEAEREKQKEIKTNLDLQKSFLQLYETYKQTGEETAELKTATEQMNEALEDSELNALAAAGAYEELAARIREKTTAEYEDLTRSAREEKAAAETKLNTLTIGNTSGISLAQRDNADGVTVAVGKISGGNEEEDIGNSTIIEEIFEGTDLLHEATNGTLYFKNFKAMSAEEKAIFYNLLQEATKHKNWESKGKLAKNVQAILNDEEFAEYASDYSTAVRAEAKNATAETINRARYSKSTSLTSFKADRDALVQEVLNIDRTLDEDEAAAIVDAQYAQVGSEEAKALSSRYTWLRGIVEADENKQGLAEALSGELGLDQMNNATFNALKLLDLDDYEGDVQKILTAAKEKEKQLLDEAWLAASEERLESINLQMEKLEKQYEKTFGSEKIKNIREQNKLLKEELEILERGAETTKKKQDEEAKAFKKLAREQGWNFDSIIDEALRSNNWEYVRAQIATLDGDIANILQPALVKLMGVSNDYLDLTNKIQESTEEIVHSKIEELEAVTEAYEANADSLDTINSLLEAQIELVELLGNTYSEYLGRSKDEIAGLAKQGYEDAENITQVYADAYQQAKENYENADEANKGAAWNELQQVASMYLDSVEATYDALTNWVKTSQEALEQAIKDKALGLAGIGNLDLAKLRQEELDKQSDRYLDSIDREYQISELERKYNKAINSTTNLTVQKTLTDLRNQQLDDLRKMEKISEKDIQRAQKQLELEQARIALQEAQSNKNQMRLVRGANGTYTYQYVADSSAIEEAEEQVASLKNELVNLDEETWRESLDQFLDDFETFIEKLQELAKDGFSDEDKEILSLMFGNIQALGIDNQRFMEYLSKSSGIDSSQLGEFFGEGFAVDLIANIVGKTLEDLDLDQLVKDYTNESTAAANSAIKGENSILSQGMAAAKEHQTTTASHFKAAVEEARKKEETSDSATTGETPTPVENPVDDSDSSEEIEVGDQANGKLWSGSGTEMMFDLGNSGWNDAVKVDDRSNVIYNSDGELISGYGEDGNVRKLYMHLGPWKGRAAKDASGNWYVKVHDAGHPESNWWAPWDKLSFFYGTSFAKGGRIIDSSKFDTGGYTGNWNSSEGKLAVLHEKEIVLNKEDTANLLKGIDILRSLNMSMLGTVAAMGTGADSSMAAWELIKEMGIEQIVNISAEFPNATDRDEIEAAFYDLINLATQHAYKNTL